MQPEEKNIEIKYQKLWNKKIKETYISCADCIYLISYLYKGSKTRSIHMSVIFATLWYVSLS